MAAALGRSKRLVSMEPAVAKARLLARGKGDIYRITDLRKTGLDGVDGPYFRLFTPVKLNRGRLPTSLPEFRSLRHTATLSDSPVTAAAQLGGHWTDHNLAAIIQLAACNFRCSYCYVDFRHLAGHDSLPTTASEIIDEFVALRGRLATQGRSLNILRISGGEPFLAPELILDIDRQMAARGLVGSCMLKVESNLSTIAACFAALSPVRRREFCAVAPRLTVHATLHARPGRRNWPGIKSGITLAVDLGIDLYPAIGGLDWTIADMMSLLDELESSARGLARRLVVRPFKLDYVERYNRRGLPVAVDPATPASMIWEGLLRAATGSAYLDVPRHQIRLS
jgi:hypothetical protein